MRGHRAIFDETMRSQHKTDDERATAADIELPRERH